MESKSGKEGSEEGWEVVRKGRVGSRAGKYDQNIYHKIYLKRKERREGRKEGNRKHLKNSEWRNEN